MIYTAIFFVKDKEGRIINDEEAYLELRGDRRTEIIYNILSGNFDYGGAEHIENDHMEELIYMFLDNVFGLNSDPNSPEYIYDLNKIIFYTENNLDIREFIQNEENLEIKSGRVVDMFLDIIRMYIDSEYYDDDETVGFNLKVS